MEQSIHAKDSDVGKLALKNSTLKAQVAMAESQLKQKEEQGDALHPIDFEQLKIEHEQYVRKIEEKNAELLLLKRATGNVVEQLSKRVGNGVIRLHHLRAIRAGSFRHISAHLVVPEFWSVQMAHDTAETLAAQLVAALPGPADVDFHTDPC